MFVAVKCVFWFNFIQFVSPLESSSMTLRKEGVALVQGRGWGEDKDSGLHKYLDKIGSLLTFLSFGFFLLNLLLNALLLGSLLLGLFGTATGGGTMGGGGTMTGTGTSTSTGGTSTSTSTGGTTTSTSTSTATGGGTAITVTGTATGTAGGMKRSRSRRSPMELSMKGTEIANSMAKELMDIVEPVLSTRPECLPALLCVSNKRASVVGHGFQYIMPFCSLGVSYFADKVTSNGTAVWTFISAIYNGVNEENCLLKHGECTDLMSANNKR